MSTHTITARLSGGIEYEITVTVPDAEALPLFMKVKDVLSPSSKSRKAKSAPKGESETDPASPSPLAEE